MFVYGGLFGSTFGSRITTKLADKKLLLTQIFAGIVATVGLYVVVRGLMG